MEFVRLPEIRGPPEFSVRGSIHKRSRPCDFTLCINRGCIFADFVKQKGTVKLLRISFDGYGCCRCDGYVSAMDGNDAEELLAWVNAGSISDQARCRSIIARYFTQNKGVVWEDALREYQLLELN